MRANDGTRTGGEILVDQLVAHGVQHAFCVPGESYLGALDAFYDRPIKLTVCRQEGGAAIMAEAIGKATGRPGIAFVTRGPGATNASHGIHIARQDSSPMILFVGQVAREMREREAFQELDFRAVFGSMTKWTTEIDDPARIPEIVSRAFYTATNGRPGPVVVALPEDMLVERVAVPDAPPFEPVETWPGAPDIARLQKLLWAAKQPIVIAGGSRWSEAACASLTRFAERFALPVATSFRRSHIFNALHECYAGDLGIGPNPKLIARIKAADVILLIGGRLGEMPSQSYSLIDIPGPRQTFVHVHPARKSSAASTIRTLRSMRRPPRSLLHWKVCSRPTTSAGARKPKPPTPITAPGPTRRPRSRAASTSARSWCGCAKISPTTPSCAAAREIFRRGFIASIASGATPPTSGRARAPWAMACRPRSQ